MPGSSALGREAGRPVPGARPGHGVSCISESRRAVTVCVFQSRHAGTLWPLATV